MGRIIVLVGPSGAGKTTISNKSIVGGPFRTFVTTTTRQPRPREVDGVDDEFISTDEFQKRVEQGIMLERDEYAGNHYGMTMSKLDEVLDASDDDDEVIYKTVLTEVGLQFLRMYLGVERVFGVYVYAPRETVERRLTADPTRTPEQVASRLANADKMGEFNLPDDGYSDSDEDGDVKATSLKCPANSCDIVVHNTDQRQVADVAKEILEAFAQVMVPRRRRKETLKAMLACVQQVDVQEES
jgi:guanylate kinase